MNNTPREIHYPQLSSGSSSSNNNRNNHPTNLHEEMLQMASTSRPAQYHFGGYYDTAFQFNAPSPPPAAAGPSLLDQEESTGLSNYFDRLSNSIDGLLDAKLASSLNFNWPDEISTSYAFPDFDFSQAPQSYLGNGMDGDMGNINLVDASSAHSVTPPSITINPFDSHSLVSHSSEGDTHAVANASQFSRLAWGSDPHFATSGYRPPLPPVTTNEDVRDTVLSMLAKPESANTTAVNSPVEIKFERIGEDIPEGDKSHAMQGVHTPSPSLSNSQGVGVKRRAEDTDGEPTPRRARRKTDSESDTSTPQKNKKKGGKRDHLTEAEKRANHIQSEQKRRNIIRQGFEDLCQLVPELRSGGFSKSAVLMHAANYLVETKKGNERLRQIVQQMEAGVIM